MHFIESRIYTLELYQVAPPYKLEKTQMMARGMHGLKSGHADIVNLR